MSINRWLALFAVAFLMHTPLLSAGDKEVAAKAAYQLKALVEDIFAGKNLAEARSAVSPEAYIVDGNSYIHLRDALEPNIVKQEHSRTVEMLSLRMEDDANSSFVIVKTRKEDWSEPHFHTIVFVKSDKGDWQIMHWHVSK